jgi:cytochrome c oxidase accessory protein FixG
MTRVAVIDERLYAAQQKIYPREVTGRFNRLRILAMVALLGVFYGLPWLTLHAHQAVLFDLPARKFYLFGLTFFPQDFFLLAWLLIIAALSLFFFTALAGRLWCGYACPQTVWTQIFVWMERLVEGSRAQQMKLDAAPWSTQKIIRKSVKQLLWIGFALFTGFTFVGYFTPVRTLLAESAAATLGGWESFWMLFYGLATYGNAGYLREQVCKYMCPYARFQSAMFDRDTLIISYDTQRGEPRGARARGSDARGKGLGDCTDCTLCVQACPTGIDIRKGLQLECIACAACIDACDSVMDKLNYPRGLVRYSTQAAMDGRKSHALRVRTAVYGTLLTLLVGGFAYAVTHRSLLTVEAFRDRNGLYREIGDSIENVYTVRVMNKDTRDHTVSVGATGLPDLAFDAEQTTWRIPAGGIASFALRVRVPAHTVTGSRDFQLIVNNDTTQLAARTHARFVAPSR